MKFFLLLALTSFEGEIGNIEDITAPTTGEYVALQTAIHHDIPAPFPAGNDPDKKYYRLKKRFQFVGPGQEPEFTKIQGSTDECIVSYCSITEPYMSWLQELPHLLKDVGYHGAFYGRIGGWPNLKRGDLALADVPYAFKLCAIREAVAEGHAKALWVDTALVPRKNLDRIFEVLDRYGYFAVSTGVSLKRLYEKGDFDLELLHALGLSYAELSDVPHVQGGLIGINAAHPHGQEVLKMWYEMTKDKEAYASGYPEEIVLSTVLYKLGYPPPVQNSAMWQEDNNPEKGRDPYFILQTIRPD